MGNPDTQLPDRIVFIADAHLGSPTVEPGGDDSDRRAANLAAFLLHRLQVEARQHTVGHRFLNDDVTTSLETHHGLEGVHYRRGTNQRHVRLTSVKPF